MAAWDSYMREFLTRLSVGSLENQYLLFIILPQFRNSSNYSIANIFTTWRTFGGKDALSKSLHFSIKAPSDSRHDRFLTDFFSDPRRSGKFYLDDNIHTLFTKRFVEYLINRYACASAKGYFFLVLTGLSM